MDEDARGVKASMPKLPSPPRFEAMSPHIDKEASSTSKPGAQATLATHATIAALNAAPTLEETVQLTRHELSTVQEHDSIIECGRAALTLLRTNPDLAVKLAYQKLHDVPYKEVKTCWRRLYTDATFCKVLSITGGHADGTRTNEAWLDEVVKLLDMTLILTAAPWREELVELWFAALEKELCARELANPSPELLERPAKKLKLENASSTSLAFPTALVEPSPMLRHPVHRCDNLGLSAFQKKLSAPATHTPLIIENAIQHWPALAERPWNDPNYLLKRTLGGRRLVPIETGRSYTDTNWGQKITTFADFMRTYMLAPSHSTSHQHNNHHTGYLAQHDLFAQIPSLRADISIPDFCYCDPTSNPLPNVEPTPKLEEPLLNAWFGPKGTISPLHTDPYHNILAQVVGYKYVRLYAPEQTKWLYPRSVDEKGVDMSNTSAVDLDVALEVYPEIGIEGSENGVQGGGKSVEHVRGEEMKQRRREFEERFPGFGTAEYVEGVIGPGECLYLPPGWWHYVRSLSPSFSVSFWFN